MALLGSYLAGCFDEKQREISRCGEILYEVGQDNQS
jgi:hypothetical protein